MKQLRLWILKEERADEIEIEERARQEVIAFMAEGIVALIKREKEDRDERVEES